MLFDLDETLVPDYGGFLTAVEDCAAALGTPAGMGRTLHERARPRWGQAPNAAVAGMRYMSSWEALRAPFPAGTGAWAEAFRLAARLAAAYREHRSARCRPFPDAVAALELLAAAGVLIAVVTNGTERHQRAKLDAAASPACSARS